MFVVVHLLGLVADSTVHFGVAQILVPFTSSWRPLAVSFGVLALWTLIAVFVTSLLRDRLSRRVWHAIHMSSYVTWIAVSAHLLGAGTDTFSRAVEILNLSAVTLVASLAVLALLGHQHRVQARSEAGGSARPASRTLHVGGDRVREPLDRGGELLHPRVVGVQLVGDDQARADHRQEDQRHAGRREVGQLMVE